MNGWQEGMCILKFFSDCVPVAVVVDSYIPTQGIYGYPDNAEAVQEAKTELQTAKANGEDLEKFQEALEVAKKYLEEEEAAGGATKARAAWIETGMRDVSNLEPKFARSLDSKQGYPAMFEKVVASSAIVPDN